MKTFSFLGKRYDLHIGDIDGLCDPPTEKNPNFIIPNSLANDQKTLETLIHETLHACFWAKTEKKVTDTAHDLARFLWRMGYRLDEAKTSS